MSRMRRLRHGEERLLADLAGALVPRRRPFPLTVVWRWRYELALTAAIAGAVTALLHVLGGPPALCCAPPAGRRMSASHATNSMPTS